MWHIFRKDVWMLRVAVLATVAQMGLWAWAEVASGGMPWRTVDLLRQFIVTGWCFTACFVTIGEPDWSTRPMPRGRLMAAKVLFMAAVFHLPYLLACAAILWGKGFLPWHYVGRLMEQQFLSAAMYTIPCLALASVTGSFGTFGVAGVAILMVTLVGTLAGAPRRGLEWLEDPGRAWWIPVLMVVFGLAVLVVQYLSRRTDVAGRVGMASVVALIAAFVLTPTNPILKLQCKDGAAGWIGAMRVGEGRRVLKAKGEMDRDLYWLPLSAPALEAPLLVRPQVLDWVMQTGGGQTFTDGFGMRVNAGSYWYGTYLYVDMTPGVRERTESGEARMNVSMRVDVSKALRPVWSKVGATSMVPGLGRCGSYVKDDENEGRFHVFCESPEAEGKDVVVTVHTRGRHWGRELSEGWVQSGTLRLLTPVRRMETDGLRVLERMPEGSWTATRAEVKDASLEFAPEERVGCELVDLSVAGRWDHAAGRFLPVGVRE
ncbi:MAG: hypothetical protein JST93_29780 [Acidobacteria bacterium]|nr:hypothetical protein [Acidobacteriota bacterium]